MKKTYMNPTMKVVVLKHRQHLLAGSTDAPISGTQANDKALAPGMNNWDDFDEDF